MLDNMEINDTMNAVDYDPEWDRYMGLPKKWKGCAFATVAGLRNAVDTGIYKFFVWPDEGDFTGDVWQFNEAHKGFEPLAVDRNSARLIIQYFELASKQENKDKVARLVESNRGTFGYLAEKLWGFATFKK